MSLLECHYAECRGALPALSTLVRAGKAVAYPNVESHKGPTWVGSNLAIKYLKRMGKMLSIKVHVLWLCFKAIMPAAATHDSHSVYAIVLGLDTLGGTTEIGSFLFLSCRPRWPRQVRKAISYHNIAGIIVLNFTNVNTA